MRDDEIDVPSDTNVPTFSKHWEELTSSEEAEDCTFQGLPLVEGWVVTGQNDATSVQDAGAKKKRMSHRNGKLETQAIVWMT